MAEQRLMQNDGLMRSSVIYNIDEEQLNAEIFDALNRAMPQAQWHANTQTWQFTVTVPQLYVADAERIIRGETACHTSVGIRDVVITLGTGRTNENDPPALTEATLVLTPVHWA
ncbi:hypothetical protein [Marinomonas sp.]|uniref:hypothetical protein n=1 Tax=Marinomonas sp. TaxID=1904862 RepID=UPI003BAD7247